MSVLGRFFMSEAAEQTPKAIIGHIVAKATPCVWTRCLVLLCVIPDLNFIIL